MSSSLTSAVIFDMDGLLLDTEQLYAEAFNEVLEPYGHCMDHDTKARHVMGKRYKESMMTVLKLFNLENELTVDELMAKFSAACDRRFVRIPVLPGAAKLVHHLYKHSVPMAVATSCGDRSFAQKTERHNLLFDMFHHVTKGTDPDVHHSKPAPDIYLVCASLFEPPVSPDRCVAFEDAPNGAAAAMAAGMTTFLVPDQRLPEDLRGHATHELASLQDFQPEKFGLPAFNYRPVSHVIFDLDGLLLDTAHIYADVNCVMLAKHGKKIDPHFDVQVMGMRGQDIIPRMLAHYDLPYTVESFEAELMPQYRALMSQVKLMEGVERLVEHLHRHEIPMAVATSSTASHFAEKTKNHSSIFEKFLHIVKGTDPDLKHGKPAPDIFLLCASKFQPPVNPEHCLVFEDAPNGVEAANAAGMQTIMIPDAAALALSPKSTMKATQMLSSMKDFRPQDFGLPPFPATITSTATNKPL